MRYGKDAMELVELSSMRFELHLEVLALHYVVQERLSLGLVDQVQSPRSGSAGRLAVDSQSQ